MKRRWDFRLRSRGSGRTTRGCRRSPRPPPPSSRSSPSGSSTPSTWTDPDLHISSRTRTYTNAYISTHSLDGEEEGGATLTRQDWQDMLDSVNLVPNPPTIFHWLQTSAGNIVDRSPQTPCATSQDETRENWVLFIRLWRTDLYSPTGPWERCRIDLSLILLCQNLFHKIAKRKPFSSLLFHKKPVLPPPDVNLKNQPPAVLSQWMCFSF